MDPGPALVWHPAPQILLRRLASPPFGHAHGIDIDDTVQIARWLADDGLDFVHISLWDGRKPSNKYPDRHPLALFRPALPAEVPILAAGKVWTRDDAEALRDHGADIIALGRAAILNPDWPRQALAGPFDPERGPLTRQQYNAIAVGDRFVDYLHRFKLVRED